MPTRRAAPAETQTRPSPEEIAAAFVQVPGTAVAIHDDTDDTDTDENTIEENDIAARVRASLGSSPGDNVRVKLYRRAPLTRKLEWCEDFPPESVINGADELIRNAWGAGAYELRVTGSTGTLAKIQIDIATRPEKAAPPAPAVPDAMVEILRHLTESQNQILARLSAPPPPPPPAMGMPELLGMLATAKQLFAQPPAPPAAGIVEMATQMRALKNLSEEFNPPAGDPDSPMTMVNGLLGVLGEAIKARAPQTATNPATVPAVELPQTFDTLPAHMPPPTPTTPTTPDPDDTTRRYLDGLAQGVIQHATEAKPAAECAAWLAEVMPPEFDPMLKLPNWLDLLCGAMPPLAPHRAYLLEVKPLLDAELARDD